jgi:hypothetical protein
VSILRTCGLIEERKTGTWVCIKDADHGTYHYFVRTRPTGPPVCPDCLDDATDQIVDCACKEADHR